MRQGRNALALWAVLNLGGLAAMAQDSYLESVDDLVAREQVRSAVEEALETYLSPAETGADRVDHAIEAAESLVPFGARAVPYLSNELEQERGATYDFCAYALGFLDDPSARQALRAAIDRAEVTPGAASLSRKAWAAWALGLLGEAEAIDLVNQGRHQAAHYPIHRDMSVLESIAYITAPESVPLLLDQLERWSKDESMQRERLWTLKALRRVAAPSAVPAVARLASGDPEVVLRNEAVATLGSIDTQESISALVAALRDPELIVRRTAAIGLDRLEAKVDLDLLAQLLETEGDSMTRGAYYRLTVRLGGQARLEALREHWGRRDPMDRRLLVEALGQMAGGEALDFVAQALTDADNSVAIAAVQVLVASGDKGAVGDVLAALKTGNWTYLQVAAKTLGQAGVTRAGPALTERMVRAVQSNAGLRRGAPDSLRAVADALVDIDYADALPRLRKARKAAGGEPLPSILDSAISRLELIETIEDNVEAWAGLMTDPTREYRLLAYRRLADIGTEPAARSLAGAFDDADDRDRPEILRQAGRVNEPATRALLERVLLDPEFDPARRLAEREMAAWSARRIGGEEMLALLRSSVERRHGRDARVLVYAAVLGGRESLPLLDETRVSRMRYLKYTRGLEQRMLARITRRIRNGQSLAESDVPPERLLFR